MRIFGGAIESIGILLHSHLNQQNSPNFLLAL
jgi:hypothetical protein